MSKAFRFHQHGGPEVLRYEDVDVGEPGPGQVRIRNKAVADYLILPSGPNCLR
jgi:NADPH2:quinone reductase